jgi:hypothetical protein
MRHAFTFPPSGLTETNATGVYSGTCTVRQVM